MLSLNIFTPPRTGESPELTSDIVFDKDALVKQVVNNITERLNKSNIPTTFDFSGVQPAVKLLLFILPTVTDAEGHISMSLFKILLSMRGYSIKGFIDQYLPKEFAKALSANFTDEIESQLEKLFKIAKVSDISNGLKQIDKFFNQYPNSKVFNLTSFIEVAAPTLLSALVFEHDYNTTAVVDSTEGKWAGSLGNVIVIDQNYLLFAAVGSFMNNLKRRDKSAGTPLDQGILSALEDFYSSSSFSQPFPYDLKDFALFVHVVLKDRTKIYESQETVQPALRTISDQIYLHLGKDYPVSIQNELAETYVPIAFLKLFFESMFGNSLFLLIIVACLLIYALMNSSVEEKTYEFGMLRALGFKQRSLVSLLTLQSFFYAVPGLIIGLLVCFVLNSFVTFLLFGFTGIATSYALDPTALLTGVSIAIIIPIVSNIIPIQRALSKALRDSLDMYHRVINEISVQIVKLTDLGLSLVQLVGAIILTATGFTTYYFGPLSFMNKKLGIFLGIVNTILLMMILGFVFLINLIQPFAERLVLKLITSVYRSDKNLQSIVEKNFEGHRRRNQKTALIFSLSLAFLIFGSTSFATQGEAIRINLLMNFGSDMVITSMPWERNYLDEQGIREYMEYYKKYNPDHIRGYTFVSVELQTLFMVKNTKISPLSQSPKYPIRVYAVEPNYFEGVYEKYLQANEYDRSVTDYPKLPITGQKDPVHALYSSQGLENCNFTYDNEGVASYGLLTSEFRPRDYEQEKALKPMRLMVAEGLRYTFSFDTSSFATLEADRIKFLVRIRQMSTKVPGKYFSGYRQVGYMSLALTSMDDLKYALDRFKALDRDANQERQYRDLQRRIPTNSSYGIPKKFLLINFAKPLSVEDRIKLGDGLNNFIKGQDSFVIDTNDALEKLEQVLMVIGVFYQIVSVVSIILSFFLVWVSFVSNVKENSWEYGVLRAIGLNKTQMNKIYVFEAVSLTTAASVLGTVVGIVVAVIVTYQFNAFSELPFMFFFPTKQFVFTLGLTFFTAIFGSIFALDDIRERQIANIIKGI